MTEASFVSLLSTWITGGQAPDLVLSPVRVHWVDWWTVLLGLSFVAVTQFAPKGIGGLIDLAARIKNPDRHGADLGPDAGALREREADQ